MKKLALSLLVLGVAACLAVEIPQGFAGGAAGPITLPDKGEGETAGGGDGGTGAGLTLTRYVGDGFSILYPQGWETYEDEESLIFDSDSDDLTAPYIEMYFFEMDPTPVQDFTDEVLYNYDMWFDGLELTDRVMLSDSSEMFMVYYTSDGVPLAEFSVTMTDPEGFALIASYVSGESRWEDYDGVTLLADMLDSIE
ncbi:MAG: hypothetical protein A2Y64_09245 [Candidatus Coatesbacteria bacterium RBG_13_66_14]|uniref:PsbP C-terminal domain-containing protein n=1 Tax=Candidatus Coatesbacteria bacterium RBG_13_66_14 TaxID=1817816 RepID=A0A1F5FIY1_9BACT|nr:MAG: hypothetical protein A2Y64_09245 [Candidatus Coatesbacteria bacterium RBG_13_66_14]